jgi:hypothetical protein
MAANPQMKMTMQIFPAFYALISLNLAASVVLYLLVSGLFRMGQNILSYKYDPKLALAALSASGETGTIEATSRRKDDGGGRASRGRDGTGGKARDDKADRADRDDRARVNRSEGSTRGASGEDDEREKVDREDKAGNGPASGGRPRSAVNVRRPGSGRVTPRGGRSRNRRGR